MNKLLAVLLTTLFATVSFAADDGMTHGNAAAEKAAQDKVDAKKKGVAPNSMPEAMKSGSEQSQAAAQKKVDARPKGKVADNKMPEAMKHGNEQAEAAAEAKKAKQ